MFRSAYSPSLPVRFHPIDDGRCRASSAAECDINLIMARYAASGHISHLAKGSPKYGDFTSAPVDYLAAMQVVLEAQSAFDSLPALTRKRFGNDPSSFMDFVADPANVDEMRSLGLLNPVRPDPTPVEPSPSPASSDGQE